MRKLMVSNLVSLDGYIAGPDGKLMAMPLFGGPIPGRLTLVDASVPEGSQNAVLTYAIEAETESPN